MYLPLTAWVLVRLLLRGSQGVSQWNWDGVSGRGTVLLPTALGLRDIVSGKKMKFNISKCQHFCICSVSVAVAAYVCVVQYVRRTLESYLPRSKVRWHSLTQSCLWTIELSNLKKSLDTLPILVTFSALCNAQNFWHRAASWRITGIWELANPGGGTWTRALPKPNLSF